MSEEICLSVTNWEKFNPRKDVKINSWLRLEHSIFEDPDLFDLNASEMAAWIYLLCCCSKSNKTNKKANFMINLRHSATVGRIPNSVMFCALDKLAKTGRIMVVRSEHVTPTLRSRTPRTNVRTNVTNVTNEYSVGRTSIEVADEGLNIQQFIGVYVKAFQKKFPGSRPVLTGKVRGQIKNFLKDHSIERASDMIQVFFQMEDKWFETKNYDFTTFMENLQKIYISLDTGKTASPKTESEKWLANKMNENKERSLV